MAVPHVYTAISGVMEDLSKEGISKAVGRTSKTVRVVIAGAPLRPAICAGTRSVSYRMDGTALIADLPKEWFQ